MIEALERAGHGQLPPPPATRETILARPSPFVFASAVAIDNDASQDATVIEASGRDRPGLVEALARAISEAGLSIQSAHIDNYGERAVDAFYVVTAEGGKLTDGAGALRARLTELLEAADATSVAGRLQKARASVAR
jgi:[protein-PII] uridylyltransferase